MISNTAAGESRHKEGMMIENEEERFLRRRLLQEESAIKTAADSRAQTVHRHLAAFYRDRLSGRDGTRSPAAQLSRY